MVYISIKVIFCILCSDTFLFHVGNGSRTACLTMVFKLALAAEKRWRRLNGSALLPDVIRGMRFVDGVKEIAA